MPIIKFGFCFLYLFNPFNTQKSKIRLIKMISAIGKWSMADVFVISILAATIKVGGMAYVTIHIGLLIFGLSVITSLILTQRLLSGYELKPISKV